MRCVHVHKDTSIHRRYGQGLVGGEQNLKQFWNGFISNHQILECQILWVGNKMMESVLGNGGAFAIDRWRRQRRRQIWGCAFQCKIFGHNVGIRVGIILSPSIDSHALRKFVLCNKFPLRMFNPRNAIDRVFNEMKIVISKTSDWSKSRIYVHKSQTNTKHAQSAWHWKLMNSYLNISISVSLNWYKSGEHVRTWENLVLQNVLSIKFFTFSMQIAGVTEWEMINGNRHNWKPFKRLINIKNWQQNRNSTK